jgi:hypothetical protein
MWTWIGRQLHIYILHTRLGFLNEYSNNVEKFE